MAVVSSRISASMRSYLQRMHQVGLTRLARLTFVMFEGEFVGFLDKGEIVVRPVGADLAQEIAKACNGQNIGRDLLAQSRHVRLYAEQRLCFQRRRFAKVQKLCYTCVSVRKANHASIDQRSVGIAGERVDACVAGRRP